MLNAGIFFYQAFCLPVIQIVYETILDALSGKKSGKILLEDEGNVHHIQRFIYYC